MDFKELKQKDLKELRIKSLPKKCPICGRELTLEDSVVDHIHTSHKSIYTETYSLVRDVICRDCNIILGKIENQYLRSKRQYKEETDLPTIIRNIAGYVEKYSKLENYDECLIHPKEIKPKKIKKSFFNKLKKEVKEKFNKDIQYPKSSKLTKEIKKYIDLLNFPTDGMYY